MTAAASVWMLDTNILSHAIRYPRGPLAVRIQQLSAQTDGALCTSLVVACELSFGAEKVGSISLVSKIETILQFVPSKAIDHDVVQHYAVIRSHLEKAGTPIGPNDTLIAAHALALDCTLVTDNEAEFLRVPGLRVENWLAQDPSHND
jgi:tRNA(fMet)-specific endonuclease VapC